MPTIKQLFFFSKVRCPKNFCRSETGSTAVEFAIILPLLALLLFGIIEFGTFMFNKQIITNASREGARSGIVSRIPRLPDSEIKAVVDKYCKTNLITFGDPNMPKTICFTPNTGEEKFGDPLTVTVTFDYHFLFLPFPKVPMEAQTVMRYE